MEQLNNWMSALDQAEQIASLGDDELEALAQMLYDTDRTKAMDLMRYIGIMDMEATLEKREGMAV